MNSFRRISKYRSRWGRPNRAASVTERKTKQKRNKNEIKSVNWAHWVKFFACQFGFGAISVPQQDEVGSVDHLPLAAIVEERRDLLDDGLIHFGEILRLGRLFHQINQQPAAFNAITSSNLRFYTSKWFIMKFMNYEKSTFEIHEFVQFTWRSLGLPLDAAGHVTFSVTHRSITAIIS